MSKKKILICSHWLELGGVERALIGLLDSFSMSDYDVDLFLYRHSGELLKSIPPHINLLPEDNTAACIAVPFKTALSRKAFGTILSRLLVKVQLKIQRFLQNDYCQESGVEIERVHKYAVPFLKPLSLSTYDLAISFLSPHYFIPNKIKAKKTIAWIHTDYQMFQVDVTSELKMWEKFDYVASISESVTASFLSVFPSLKEKIVLIENILPAKLIRSQADLFAPKCEMSETGIRLLSIGRYSHAKNFDNIPDICSRLILSGLDVYWYIIGFGGDEELLRAKISESHMEERVILLGKKENPYPYIKACDVYVQPSRYEGKSVAVREAQFFCKPVIITDYPTASSQLEDGVDGVIVPMDNEGCAKGIEALLRDSKKITLLAENCSKRDYTNCSEIQKVYNLM